RVRNSCHASVRARFKCEEPDSAIVAAGEIIAARETEQTACWTTGRARSRTSWREMGEDGGALVQSRREQAGDRGRSYPARFAHAGFSIKKTRRDRIVRAQQHSAGDPEATRRFQRACAQNFNQERRAQAA